jgi:NADPH-dependent F420 reductase
VTGAVPGADVEFGENHTAAEAAPVVAVAVPFAAQAQTYKSIADALAPGTIVVDATVPLAPAVGGKPTRILGVWQGSAAEQAAELVSAFHTVSAAMLADPEHRFEEDVLVCGDDADAKAVAFGLVEAIEGLRAVDAGRLEQSRIAESLTAMMIGINIRNKTHAGIRITGL